MTTSIFGVLKLDLRANKGNPKGKVIVSLYRIASTLRARSGLFSRLAYVVVGSVYKFTTEWVWGVEIPASTKIGPGLAVFHGFGLVVNPSSVIGAHVTLRHSVTIGNKGKDGPCPVIDDHVTIGAGAVIIGPVIVGKGARIGALSLVTTDVPAHATVLAPRSTILPGREVR